MGEGLSAAGWVVIAAAETTLLYSSGEARAPK